MPPSTRHDRDDLHIEIYVSRKPGSLSVSSYSDDDTRTLAHAIAEAEAFIATCRAIQADIERPCGAHSHRITADTPRCACGQVRSTLYGLRHGRLDPPPTPGGALERLVRHLRGGEVL